MMNTRMTLTVYKNNGSLLRWINSKLRVSKLYKPKRDKIKISSAIRVTQNEGKKWIKIHEYLKEFNYKKPEFRTQFP